MSTRGACSHCQCLVCFLSIQAVAFLITHCPDRVDQQRLEALAIALYSESGGVGDLDTDVSDLDTDMEGEVEGEGQPQGDQGEGGEA